MKRYTQWILAATACLTLTVAPMAAQDAPAATDRNMSVDAQHHRQMHRKMARMSARKHMGMLAKELNLTDAQKTQIKNLHEQQRAKAQELKANESLTREQKMEQFQALRESTHSQVQGVLTPEQQKQFSEIKAKHKEHMGKRRARRGDWGHKPETAEAPKSESTPK